MVLEPEYRIAKEKVVCIFITAIGEQTHFTEIIVREYHC